MLLNRRLSLTTIGELVSLENSETVLRFETTVLCSSSVGITRVSFGWTLAVCWALC